MTPTSRLGQLSDHGVAVWFDSISRERLASGGLTPTQVLAKLSAVGVDYDDDVEQLERLGVSKFVDAWNHLLEHLQQSMTAAQHG